MNALPNLDAFSSATTFHPRDERRSASVSGWLIRTEDNSFWEYEITDLSYGGCKVKTNAIFSKGEVLRLGLPRCGPTDATVRWASGNIAGLKFGAEAQAPAQLPRQSKRHPIKCPVTIRRSGRRSQYIDARNISLHGCFLTFTDPPRVGENIWIKLPGLEALETEVRWVVGFKCGAAFKHPIHPAVFDLLLLRLGDNAAPQSSRLRY